MQKLKETDRLQFGEHKGKTIKEIVKTHPKYIKWLQRKYIIELKTVKL